MASKAEARSAQPINADEPDRAGRKRGACPLPPDGPGQTVGQDQKVAVSRPRFVTAHEDLQPRKPYKATDSISFIPYLTVLTH